MKYKIFVVLFLILLPLLTGCQKTVIYKPPPVSIPPDAKLVCIFFDDGFTNQYDEALPVLLQYDFKASFGIITDYIGTGHGIWEYMDLGHIEDLAKLGMDIAGHTKTHPHLRTLTDEQLREEIFDSKQYLEEMGFEVTTIAYPYYEWDDRVVDYVIAANYTCGRGGWLRERVFDPDTTDSRAKYSVAAWQITDQTMDEFKLIVDMAGPNSVVCLVYHLIADEGPESTCTPLANFLEQMDYLKNAGFTVIPLPDIFRH